MKKEGERRREEKEEERTKKQEKEGIEEAKRKSGEIKQEPEEVISHSVSPETTSIAQPAPQSSTETTPPSQPTNTPSDTPSPSASASIENIPTETKKCKIEYDYSNLCFCIVLSDGRKKLLYPEITIAGEKSKISSGCIMTRNSNEPTLFNILDNARVDFYIETVDTDGNLIFTQINV